MGNVKELALAGAIPGGTHKNLAFYQQWIQWNAVLSETEKLMFCDAQTSGGLMVAIPGKFTDQIMQELKTQGIENAVVIGQITAKGKGIIHVI